MPTTSSTGRIAGIKCLLNGPQVGKTGFRLSVGCWGNSHPPPPVTHLRVAGLPSNWAGNVTEDLINSFIGSGQEAGSLLRNPEVWSGTRDPRGLWGRIHSPTRLHTALPQAAGYFQASLALSHPQGQQSGCDGGYTAVLAQ